MVTMVLCRCVIFCAIFALGHGIYLNETKKKDESNVAVWTDEGVWGPLLEEWTVANHRVKRVMRLPTTDNTYVISERIGDADDDQKEGKIAPGKIVNNPTQKPPGREVSETDLYLLSAIEKLVHRVDFMEKRLRRVEEMMYYVMAGNRIDHEPCPDNFTRISSNCYYFYTNAGREMDWKAANKHCKKRGAFLVELETVEENQDVIAHIQTSHHLRGKDFWSGGLNPGLLWIWSNSGRPVNVPGATDNKNQNSGGIVGQGRCLKVAYDAALRSYGYKGADCGARYSFICELPENTSSNEISRIGRSRNVLLEN